MPGRGHYDIPLRRDATGRFLPWIIALMVYLAALSLAAALMLSDLASRWDTGLGGSLAVQVSPLAGRDAQPLDARVQAVLKALSDLPAVADARALTQAESRALLEPWLGDGALVAELPVPILIDVRLAPGADAAAVAKALARIPGTGVEDPGAWLEDLRRLAASVQWVAAIVVLLIGGAAVAAVIFAASAGLAVHRAEVELLHVIGASDRYIAAQFQRHVVRLTILGGGAGLALALATLLGLDWVARGLDAAMLPRLTLTPTEWTLLLLVPLAAAALAALTARVTVMRALERLP